MMASKLTISLERWLRLTPVYLFVPPPRHKYPDRNSELTEIYLRF
jgi:hypothetical protein